MQIKKDYTREQIVEVAKQVFMTKGYTKTSMRDIAAGVGIGVSNIYNYFKSKDELFRHIVAPLLKELEPMMYEHHNVNDQDQSADYALNDQLHAIVGYDLFHADSGTFAIYKNNSELFIKLKYSF